VEVSTHRSLLDWHHSMNSVPPIVVVEDDPWTRLIGVILDPTTSGERCAAFADYMSPDEPNFASWCDQIRARVGGLYPSAVRFVSSHLELRANLPPASALVVEALAVGAEELRCAPQLKVVHKYGAILRNIDIPSCADSSVKVLGVRRRANIACAEHAFALMLTLARRIGCVDEPSCPAQLPPSKSNTSNRIQVQDGNFGPILRARSLSGSTIGIIGLGEIGREIALRAAAFGMNILYFQRTRLPPSEEEMMHVTYRPLHALLAQSDWIVPQLPSDLSTRHFIDREKLSLMKPGACLINISRAEVVERNALIEALRSGHLGGFALDPLYQEPGRHDDELLAFDNVILTPHTAGSPRTNGLRDIEDLITGIAHAISE
jgi:phosphoglycerate dehydrogenase-like enzyme